MCSLAVGLCIGSSIILECQPPTHPPLIQLNATQLSGLSIETASSREPSWTFCASDGHLPLCSDSPMWQLSLSVLWLFPSLCLPQTINPTKARTYPQVLLQHLHGCSGMSVKTRKDPVQSIILSRTQLKNFGRKNFKTTERQKFKWLKAQVYQFRWGHGVRSQVWKERQY